MTQERGRKFDGDKPRLDLLLDFHNALISVGEVATFGAKKYAPHDWLLVPDAQERYTAAMIRHLLQEGCNEYDEETELLHAAHVAWNALARLELLIRHKHGL